MIEFEGQFDMRFRNFISIIGFQKNYVKIDNGNIYIQQKKHKTNPKKTLEIDKIKVLRDEQKAIFPINKRQILKLFNNDNDEQICDISFNVDSQNQQTQFQKLISNNKTNLIELESECNQIPILIDNDIKIEIMNNIQKVESENNKNKIKLSDQYIMHSEQIQKHFNSEITVVILLVYISLLLLQTFRFNDYIIIYNTIILIILIFMIKFINQNEQTINYQIVYEDNLEDKIKEIDTKKIFKQNSENKSYNNNSENQNLIIEMKEIIYKENLFKQIKIISNNVEYLDLQVLLFKAILEKKIYQNNKIEKKHSDEIPESVESLNHNFDQANVRIDKLKAQVPQFEGLSYEELPEVPNKLTLVENFLERMEQGLGEVGSNTWALQSESPDMKVFCAPRSSVAIYFKTELQLEGVSAFALTNMIRHERGWQQKVFCKTLEQRVLAGPLCNAAGNASITRTYVLNKSPQFFTDRFFEAHNLTWAGRHGGFLVAFSDETVQEVTDSKFHRIRLVVGLYLFENVFGPDGALLGLRFTLFSETLPDIGITGILMKSSSMEKANLLKFRDFVLDLKKIGKLDTYLSKENIFFKK